MFLNVSLVHLCSTVFFNIKILEGTCRSEIFFTVHVHSHHNELTALVMVGGLYARFQKYFTKTVRDVPSTIYYIFH